MTTLTKPDTTPKKGTRVPEKDPTPRQVIRAAIEWLKTHPKSRWALIFATICTVCYIANIAPAFADEDVDASTFYLPLASISDSADVPLSRYFDLPFEQGGATAPVEAARYIVASTLWGAYVAVFTLPLVTLEFVVSFEWLSWFAAPFETVTEGVADVLGGAGLITLGVALSATWIAIGFLRGRTGASFIELAMVIIIYGVITSPVVDPVDWLAGDSGDVGGESGLIRQAADAGADTGAHAVGGGGGDSITMTSPVIDIGIRRPLLMMSFGEDLTGECEEIWNEAASNPSDYPSMENVREEVVDCDDAVEEANDSTSMTWLFTLIMAVPTMLAMLCLAVVGLIFIAFQLIMVLISAFMTVVRAFFALFPGNSRIAWLYSLFQVFVSACLIGVTVFAITVYMWMLGEIISAMPAPVIQVGATFLGIMIIVACFTFWRMHKAGKSLSDTLSKAFGKTGLNTNAERKPSRFGTTSGNLAKSGARHAMQGRQTARMLKGMSTAGTVAAGFATGGTAAAAAKVGTGLAKKQATTQAMSAVSKQAQARKGGAPSTPSPGAPGASPASAGSVPTGGQAPAPSSGMPPVNAVAPPEGGEGLPQSPLPPRSPINPGGQAPTPAEGAEQASTANSAGAPSAGPANSGVPAQSHIEPPTRMKNLAPGNYGSGSTVHKNGQLTTSAAPGSAETLPAEEKAKRFSGGDTGWVTKNSGAGSGGNRPSTTKPAPAQPTPTYEPESPAQSSGRSTQATPRPMESRRSAADAPAPKPTGQTQPEQKPQPAQPKPQQAQPQPPKPAEQAAPSQQQKPQPRAMRKRGGNELGGGNQ